jgi:uncharacterized protein (DUF111 family)
VPVAIPVALVIGGALGYQSGLPPYGVPIGLAVAALGAGLVRAHHGALPVPARGR